MRDFSNADRPIMEANKASRLEILNRYARWLNPHNSTSSRASLCSYRKMLRVLPPGFPQSPVGTIVDPTDATANNMNRSARGPRLPANSATLGRESGAAELLLDCRERLRLMLDPGTTLLSAGINSQPTSPHSPGWGVTGVASSSPATLCSSTVEGLRVRVSRFLPSS